jgi:hypothetical protein
MILSMAEERFWYAPMEHHNCAIFLNVEAHDSHSRVKLYPRTRHVEGSL